MPIIQPLLQRLPILALLGLLLIAPMRAGALDPSKSFHHYVRDSWSIEQGLPQISALTITQDADGYLWVGTQAGLARFDGHRFVAYTPQTNPELPGGFITDLLHDRHGRLWIATYKGLAMREHGRFASVPLQQAGSAPAPAPNIVALAVRGDELLAAADNAVYGVEQGALVARHRLPGPARSLLTQGELLWVGSLGGVYRIERSGAIEYLRFPNAATGAAATQLLLSGNRLWAGTSQGLFYYEEMQWQRYEAEPNLSKAPIEGLLEDRDGNLWVAEIAHLTRLRGNHPHERVVLEDAALAVRAMFEDREGNLWLGSQWNGISRLRNGWTHRYSLREGLHTPLLWSVAEGADDTLWVGSDEGLSRFRDGRFEPVVAGNELPHPNAYTLLVEGDSVWIGTRRGLALYRNGQLLRPPVFDAVRAAQINGLLRDHSGALWLATSAGLYRHDGTTLHRYAEAQGLADPRIRTLLQTSTGRLLVATHSGLFEFRDERLLPLGLDQGLPAGLDITAVHELDDQRLVIGSISEELFYFDGGRWIRFGVEQGVPANAAFFLGHDTSYLWVAGIRGIQRIPLQDMVEVAAGRHHLVRGQMLLNERGDRRGGQKGFCCNGAGIAKGLLRNGVLWAPTRDGLVALATREVRFAAQPPNTLIERLRYSGGWRDVEAGQLNQLPAEARDLGFEFTAISFEDPRSIGFRYRLRGYHDDWREPDEAYQRVVSYTNLPPGPYTFEVQGSNVDEVWSEAARVSFSIRPYFRETWSFYGLLVLAILLIGFAGYRWQRRRYALQAQELELLVQHRTEALAEANHRLQEATHTDPLTGLRNRRYLAIQIPKDLAFYGRELRRGGSLGQVIVFAIVDIDHFKRVNDEHGHAAGDRVLQQFAEVLLAQVRTGDYVARWGGEEFVVVFRPTPFDHIPVLGERIRSATAAHAFDIGASHTLNITCSIGLVEYPLFFDLHDALSWEQLIELADRAMYYIKRHGRNGWGAFRPAPDIQVSRVIELLRLDETEFERSDELELVGAIDGLPIKHRAQHAPEQPPLT